ncbi:CoA ester lyase [Actinocorallia sp. API 0066]|uniref:HpcH/HpaI aldolase/citrate lyase family protein n=1 Tax=Actinocorallia sp. API 0066 TaxID=2896846 RepID=UPI001E5D73DA|nr:CoA ester lyase [Actinocorallia sp. API 0066]MCD0451545.1 CoA ester lyase [Actinocorallia sp. API 0066]
MTEPGPDDGLLTAVARRARDAATLLFVPGDRPERFAKAAAAGADLVIIDLEDAVPPGRKDEARAHAAEWIAAGHTCAVRVNAHGTRWHDADTAALAGHRCAVMLPKAEDPAVVRRLVAHLGAATPLIALIETARGVLAARDIAAVPGVRRLAFGGFDLAAELGVDPADRDALYAARSALVLASASAGLTGPVDGVTGNLSDDGLLTDDVRYARRLGCTGKLCVHPRQVPVAAAALRPTADEVRWAEAVVAAAAGAGAIALDGQMIDKPVLDRARRLLRTEHEGNAS